MPLNIERLTRIARPAVGTLRSAYRHARRLADLAPIWNWDVHRIHGDALPASDIAYVGRELVRRDASALFGKSSAGTSTSPTALSTKLRRATLVTECPLPGALKVAAHLTSLVPLDATMDEVLARCDSELRRKIKKLSGQGYAFRQVTERAEVERVYREMLVPFAEARHGDDAVTPSLEEVMGLARRGRLDLLLKRDEAVGAHLGYTYAYRGTRRFITERFGYPTAVFSEPKRLADANAMNVHLACTHAHATGHDYYDLGIARARPDDGLLQFKRRRRTTLEQSMQGTHFYVLFPAGVAATQLALSPLFSLSGSEVTLNVGVRTSDSDDDVVARFHEWGWDGLARVRLVAERPVSTAAVEKIRAHYAARGATTRVDVSLAPAADARN